MPTNRHSEARTVVRPIALVLLGVCLCNAPLVSQDTPAVTERRTTLVAQVFNDVESLDGPGYAVGIVEKGVLAYARGFGSANLDYHIPITPSSVFNVASLSKQFTAAAIALLVLDGRIALDDPIADYLPEFPARFGEVQVRHLVYMTSGLPEYYELPRPGDRDWSLDYFTVPDALQAVFAAPSLDFRPGSRWAYRNSNYQVLAELVARVSGSPLSQFLDREIFEPLGMASTHINDDLSRVVPGRVSGYNRTDDGTYRREIRRSPHFGGSGLFTSVEDLAIWDRSLRDGSIRSGELATLMLQTQVFEHDKTNDALGLVWSQYRGRRTLWYEGGDLGFSSYMVRLPDDDVSVIVLSNLGTGRALDRARAILDILFPDS